MQGEKITILFIETGDFGGGSFESLYQIVSHIDRERFHPLVLYLNKTKYIAKMQDLGISVYLLNDFLYNRKTPHQVKRVLVGLSWSIGNFIPPLLIFYIRAIHFKTISNIRSIVRKENGGLC